MHEHGHTHIRTYTHIETELFAQIETQLLKEKDEDKQPPGQLSEDLLL